ncbi:hypothetical protein [Chryseobacterium sp.]|uniref:hypothetical protein n=1 Tax=Chryseobacterium sp. TaxID=1871047 RepID=UPI002FC60E62
MQTETTYSEFDLEKGICTCCGQLSEEILIDDGRCVDCVEDEKFFDETMKDLK